MRLHKKAQLMAYYLKWAVSTLLFLIVGILVLGIVIGSFLRVEVNLFPVEADLLVTALIMSGNGLAYVDQYTGRTYPGEIDVAKLQDSAIEEKLMRLADYGEDQQYLAAEIRIGDQTIYYNKQWYNRWKELKDFTGPGAVQNTTITRTVLVRDQDSAQPVILQAEVLQPK